MCHFNRPLTKAVAGQEQFWKKDGRRSLVSRHADSLLCLPQIMLFLKKLRLKLSQGDVELIHDLALVPIYARIISWLIPLIDIPVSLKVFAPRQAQYQSILPAFLGNSGQSGW